MKAARWLVMLPAMLPGACHFEFTGPLLWNHTSSAAFEMWIAGWFLSGAVVFWAWVWAGSK